MAKIPYKTFLTEHELPREWQNLRAYLPHCAPMLHPGTGLPVQKSDMENIFCEALIDQEMSSEKFIPIPKPVRDFYKMYRPSPLVRAYSLEKALSTPAEIYYKFEGTNTSGSHKLNSAVAQAYYAKEQGLERLVTETGAGQWGTALAMACGYFGLDLTVYMVRCSAQQKPYRKAVMETYGATVIPSPSETTAAGRAILAAHPDTAGSLGCAISEAVEATLADPNCRYVLGSVLNYVVMHQSVIGLETKAALEKLEVEPDIIIGCAGGGSNLGGLLTPFAADRLEGKNNIRFLAVEPASCPSLTRGRFAYDFADVGRTTPLCKMYTLGCSFLPSPDHAGGLRYHGMSPILSELRHEGLLDAVSVKQSDVFTAATMFARCEGTLPAPESAHAILAAVREAQRCKEEGKKETIVFGLTGTGYFDLSAYSKHREGAMTDSVPTDTDLAVGFAELDKISVNQA